MVDINDITEAMARIGDTVRKTEVRRCALLSDAARGAVYLKLENTQITGSFKLRGALNLIGTLQPRLRQRGVITASTGNHGAGVAFAAEQSGTRATVFVPESTPDEKLTAVRASGAEIRRVGQDCVETENQARAFAESNQLAYIPPYNHPAIVAGQGTVGLELIEQLPQLDNVFIAVGGGGLIGGVGTALKALKPTCRVFACSPSHSAPMHESLRQGRQIELVSRPTLSDSTAGGIEADSITFPICQSVVDHSVVVSELDIARAMAQVYDEHQMIVEGAAGVAVAGFLQCLESARGQTSAIVICGGNIPTQTFQRAMGMVNAR